jgi:hypothetical protein
MNGEEIGMALRTFSYGGGVQSTAALVLAAEGKIDFNIFLFANTGDDSENPKSLVYVREVAMPYAAAHGIALHELSRIKRDGTVETLYGRLTKAGARSIGIPVRMSESGAPGTRACTADFKIRVIAKWQKQHGATKAIPAICGLGISLDEIHRARSNSGIATQTLEYPLIDLRLSRQDCVNIIERAGLPVPPKSSCYFCPFHSRAFWARQQREEPELFAKSVDLERQMNAKRSVIGKDPVWLTSALVPLDMAIVDVGQMEFDWEPFACAGGASCMT